jgi:Protein of unknown function (DUF3800)
MHIAYVDDSGDNTSVVLGVVLVPAAQWLDVHDQLVGFRSELAKNRDFRMRRELKATDFLSRGGPWHKLQVEPRTRLGIYRAALRELRDAAPIVRTFGVVIPDRNDPRLTAPAVEEAWDIVLQRLERFCFYEKTHCLLMPDDGNPLLVRKLARRKRRFGYAPSAFGGAGRKVPFRQLVDDPAHRDSRHTYLGQWADLVAYAAFRRIIPRGDFPQTMWETMDSALLGDVNKIERGKGSAEPTAIIVWPGRMKA